MDTEHCPCGGFSVHKLILQPLSDCLIAAAPWPPDHAHAPFATSLPPLSQQGLTSHNCINLRWPARRGIYAWEFERDCRELKVRVEGQLILNTASLILNVMFEGYPFACRSEAVEPYQFAANPRH